MMHISLFSGIGGFDLASHWVGWKNIATCEIAEFPRKVLQYHFPDAYHHDDIKTLTYETINAELSERFGSEWRNDEIIITGGFPCQPYSAAGKRLGKEDDRHLWPEMLRIIREVRPAWIVGENVLGLVNWSGGLVFQEVQADLEAKGYEVQPFVLPAASVGAPHRRDRVWFVAYANNKGLEGSEKKGNIKIKGQKQNQYFAGLFCSSRKDYPAKPTIRGRNDGIPYRLDDITFSKWRNESIKAYGNAIVPQVALQIFKAIEAFNHSK